MLLKYYKLLLLGLFLLVSGCFQVFSCESKIDINNLPEATVGKPYYAKIEIWGGTMVDEDNIKWETTPNSNGLITKVFKDEWAHYRGREIYRGIEIEGIPKDKGNITYRLYGNSSKPKVCHFDKTFVIKVNPAAE